MPEADISDADLDRMSEEELIDLIKAALERLSPARLREVIDAVGEKRRAKEAEVEEAFFAEMRKRAMEVGLSLASLQKSDRVA